MHPRLALKAELLAKGLTIPLDATTPELEALQMAHWKAIRPVKPKPASGVSAS